MNCELSSLREAIEAKMGKKLETNKDFDSLSNSIHDELHDRISSTTLKRIWGYVSEPVNPRHYTLSQLARFVGYADWDAFCASQGESENTTPSTSPETEETIDSSVTKRSLGNKSLLILAALIAVIAIALLLFLSRSSSNNPRILNAGQHFATYDDFLPLFGITAQYNRHYQYVPGVEHIAVWSPQYHNPYYHNDGNPDSLMPTITEYWTPVTDSTEMTEEIIEKMHQYQKEAYHRLIEFNDVRIVFMRDLFDSTYVFLGVYRPSLYLSDTTKVVWQRADDHCDLDNIPALTIYRSY